MTEAQCRLFVYLARSAPIALVLRRGPSSWVRLSIWHTDSDTFEHGQWFKGRVYEHRCDVSPDGSLFVYFARKGGGPSVGDLHVESWVAISRTPWFTALAIWPVGGTYCLGGFFVDDSSVCVGGWLDEPKQGSLPDWLSLTNQVPYVDRTREWSERTVYFNRLLRDGWEIVGDISTETTWQRMQPKGRLTLEMKMSEVSGWDYHGVGGPFSLEYKVFSTRGHPIPLGTVRWADWDHRGRLVMAQHGKLMQWQPGGELHEILDFNPQTPDPQPPPQIAHVWPDRPRKGR